MKRDALVKDIDLLDEEIINLTLKDPAKYGLIIKRYERKLLRYIMRISGLKKEDAEDILQETFLAVYRNLNKFDPSLKFSSWIYRITHNNTISFLRKTKNSRKTIDIEDRELGERLASNIDLETTIHKGVMIEAIYNALKNLDPQYRSCFYLRYYEGMDYSEISDILKLPVGTVGTLINRGKKILKENLNKNVN